MIRMAHAVTALVGMQVEGKIGEQGGKRHGKRMKIKRPSLVALLASKKETSARRRKADATSSSISLIGH